MIIIILSIIVIDVEKEDPMEAVPSYLGDFPDVVVETSGVPSAINSGLSLTRVLGRLVVIGLSGGLETSIRFDQLVLKGVTIASDNGQAGNGRDAMKIINSHKYAIDKINNSHYTLEQTPQAFEDTASPPQGFIKAAIVMD